MINLTITRSLIFRGLRELAKRDYPDTYGKLLECPYCLMHWIAAVYATFEAGSIGEWPAYFGVNMLAGLATGAACKWLTDKHS